MRIDRAYCVQLDEVMDIVTAQLRYFQQDQPRKRFRFECSDEVCRIACHPTVTAALYDRPSLLENERRRMQFKRGPEATHLPTCRWVEKQEAAAEERRRYDGNGAHKPNRHLTFDAIDATEVVDVFHPLLLEDVDPLTAADQAEEARIRRLRTRSERVREYARLSREQLYHTPYLEPVVASYRGLQPDERVRARLDIPGLGRHLYAYHFQHVEHWNEHSGHRIFFGGARLRTLRSGYRFEFFDRVATNDGEHLVTLFISTGSIARFRGRSRLIEQLKQIDQQAGYATCFGFGHIGLRHVPPTEPSLDLVINSLDHLVLIPKRAQRRRT